LSIALKEANETEYWMVLLKDSEYIAKKMHDNIKPDISELKKILTSSINTAKKNLKK